MSSYDSSVCKLRKANGLSCRLCMYCETCDSAEKVTPNNKPHTFKGIKRGRWAAADKEIANNLKLTNAEVAKLVNRTTDSVYQYRVRTFGLRLKDMGGDRRN